MNFTPTSTSIPHSSLTLVQLLCILLLLSGCSVGGHYDAATMHEGRPVHANLTQSEQQSIDELTQAIQSLGTAKQPVDPAEAALVARDAHIYAMVLATQYDLVQPALLHNFLVNTGARERGLCFHWTHDLTHYFLDKNLQTLDLHWIVGFRDNQMLEHNGLAVTAKGEDYQTGILLDPWRQSGELLWLPVKADTKYPWELIESYTKPKGSAYLLYTYERTLH